MIERKELMVEGPKEETRRKSTTIGQKDKLALHKQKYFVC